jgi:hypothetical protein
MKHHKWLFACLALLAAGLIAACGGSDNSGDTSASSTPDLSTSSSSTTTEASGEATPDDVYQACLDALNGVASESVVQNGCARARDAFEQCTTQASNAPEGTARNQALQACQEAANRATDALKSSP